MTFQFRTDLTEKTPAPDLLRYIGQLEQRVALADEVSAAQAPANLQRQFGLSRTEAILLCALADGRVHGKDHLLDVVHGNRPDEPPGVKIVDVYVCKIRQKLRGTAIEVRTVWGSGYDVADLAPLRRAMAGEPIERSLPPTEVPGKPKGAKPMARYGAVLDMAKTALREWSRGGKVKCTGAALSCACENRAGGADLIRRLEKRGFLKVLQRPAKGGTWVLRLL